MHLCLTLVRTIYSFTMKPRYFLLLPVLVLFGTPFLTQAQGVTVGAATAPDASAILDIQSPTNNKGVLFPRLTAATRLGITAPATGLFVYQTDAPTTGTGAGTFAGYYYNGGTPTAPTWQYLATIPTTHSASFLNPGSTFAYVAPIDGFDENPTLVGAVPYYSAKGQYNAKAILISYPCTLSQLQVKLVTLNATTQPTDAVTVTLYKNGVATALSATATSSAAPDGTNSATSATQVSVAAGDYLAYVTTQTNPLPYVQVLVSLQCR